MGLEPRNLSSAPAPQAEARALHGEPVVLIISGAAAEEMPLADLEALTQGNDARLAELIEARRGEIPFIGFQGTTLENLGLIQASREINDGCLAVFETKSQDARKFLLDLYAIAGEGLCYSERDWDRRRGVAFEPGGIVVVKLISPSVLFLEKVAGFSPRAEYTHPLTRERSERNGEVGALVVPGRFAEQFKGVVEPAPTTDLLIPFVDHPEIYRRLEVLELLRRQYVVSEALRFCGLH